MAKHPPRSDSSAAPKAPRARRTKAPAAAATPIDSAADAAAMVAESPVVANEPPPDITARSMGLEPSDEDIRLRAYHRYLERGGDHGRHVDDWFDAEQDLRKK